MRKRLICIALIMMIFNNLLISAYIEAIYVILFKCCFIVDLMPVIADNKVVLSMNWFFLTASFYEICYW